MVRPDLRRRLTPIDAGFLYAERPTQPLHIGFCIIYEGQLTRDTLLAAVRDRLHLVPRYRQRVVFPPFAVAHPTWEDDPDFDLDYHITEATLPPPADERVLGEVGGEWFAPMLDRSRPLWQLIVLRGLPDDATAVIWKVHHAMVDGISAVDLLHVLHDLTPDAPPPPPPPTPWHPRPLPDPLTLLQEGLRDQWAEAATAPARQDPRGGWPWPAAADARAPQLQRALASATPALLQPAPPTPFNGPLTGARRIAWASFSFTEIRTIRAVLGGTVNDVVLAVLAGALGRYLQAHGYPTAGVELRVGCPVNMRGPEERGTLGNVVTTIIVPLYVGITDPVARLAAERAAMDRLKREDQAGTLHALAQSASQIPPIWLVLGAQVDVPNTLLNCFSTNVPGPQVPLYLAGHKVRSMALLGPLGASLGVFNAILSYNQQLTMAATVDPTRVPDGWFYVDCLQASFAELREAAEQALAASLPASAPAQRA